MIGQGKHLIGSSLESREEGEGGAVKVKEDRRMPRCH